MTVTDDIPPQESTPLLGIISVGDSKRELLFRRKSVANLSIRQVSNVGDDEEAIFKKDDEEDDGAVAKKKGDEEEELYTSSQCTHPHMISSSFTYFSFNLLVLIEITMFNEI